MRIEHIPSVMEIEREAFPLPWPENAYRYEVTQNEMAFYYVLCPEEPAAWPDKSPRHRLRYLTNPPKSPTDVVLAYGGFWLMVDEAHISTLAVRRDLRQRGLGQLLLIALLEEAERIGAVLATLEVRVSNSAARALYTRYGFEQVGRRKAYYRDNGEDALIMTTPHFSLPDYRALISRNRNRIQSYLAGTVLDKTQQMH
jgi:ribosomal-protein-alanine N-acetyltransferase